MTITQLKPFNRDDRGYNCEYYHDRIGQQMLVFSRAGAIRGGHYHKGDSLTKNPEIILLLSGTCMVKWREPNALKMESQRVEGPAKIIIPPYTWHQFVFETDGSMLEMNSLSEHANDTYYEQ